MPLLHRWLDVAAQQRGGQRALVYRDTYLSWRGLQHRVARRAQEMADMGIGPGTWVGLMLGNVPDFVILTLALDKLGAVTVPLDPATAAKDMEMILGGAPLRATVTRPTTGSTTPMAAPPAGARPPTPLALRVTDVTRAGAPKHVPEVRKRLTGTLLNVNFYKPVEVALEMPAPVMVAYTTDAGGDPKGVLRGDAQLAAMAASLGEALAVQPGNVAILPTPFHFSAGFDAGLLLGLAHGMTMILEDEFSAKGLARLLKEDVADLVIGTPAQYMALCHTLSVPAPTAPRALCVCVESPGIAAAADAFKGKFQATLVPLVHSAETGPLLIERGGVRAGQVSSGQPLPGINVRITAPDGTHLPAGVPGQVWLQSKAVSAAAVPQLPRAIRKVGPVGVPIGRSDPEGWFRTGDVGSIESGTARVTLTEREDDLVWVEGRRLALGEVESCLEASKLVRAAQARIVYDELAGPIVVARVVATAPCHVEDLIEHCARYLAPFKVPRQIELCHEL